MAGVIQLVTQQGNAETNDCAWACLKMLEDAYVGASPSIRELAMRYGRVNQFTTIAQLVRGLNAEGVPATWSGAATWSWYREKWDAGVPVIGLLAMHEVRDNDGYGWAHFAVAVGTSGGNVLVFNPLKWTGPQSIPEAEFRRAISERSKYVGGTNAPFQAVYPLHPLAHKPARPAAVILDELQNAAIAIQAEAAGRRA